MLGSSPLNAHVEANERLLALVGCIHGLVIEVDAECRYLNAWADDPALLARPAHEMIGHTIEEILGAEGAALTAMCRRVLLTGVVENVEYPLDLHGTRRWFFADIKRVVSAGRATVVLFARDITDRKATEEALARSEERFRLSARATNDVLWDWQLATECVTWNVALRTLLGHDAVETHIDWWKDLLHPDDRARVLENLNRAFDERATEWSDHYRLRRSDNTYADVIDRGFISRDAAGVAHRMVGSIIDVTKMNQMQAQLLQADRLNALGRLAAGVGHEINNPLAYVLGNLEIALETLGPSAGEAHELLVEARDGANRIASIVRSLKLFTRSDSGERRTVEVQPMLDAAIELADSEFRHKARLVRDFCAGARIHANESQLAQVFLHLLVRAARAIPEGSPTDAHTIEVTTRIVSGHVSIQIRDTGAPIATHDLDLAISHGILDLHGGSISLQSDGGNGTTFLILLPLVAPPSRSLPSILVIDDEEAIGRLLARMLRGKADVDVLTRAKDAITPLLTKRFDVVLCDVMMPEMTGIELYEHVHSTRPDLAERFVFITGGAFTPDAQAFIDSAVAPCLDKPLDRSRVLALLPARSQ